MNITLPQNVNNFNFDPSMLQSIMNDPELLQEILLGNKASSQADSFGTFEKDTIAELEKSHPLIQKRESILGWMNNIIMGTVIGKTALRGIKSASQSKLGKKLRIPDKTRLLKKNLAATKTAEKIAKTSSVIKKLKGAKTIGTWISRAFKLGGAALAPLTGGTSFLAGLAISFAAEIVVGEAIDVGITVANGGKILEDSKDDYIKLGDWLGQGMHQVLA